MSEESLVAESPRWDAIAREASRHRGTSVAHEELRQVLAFTLDAAPYALPIERVREIVRLRPATPVPRLPSDVRGVISLRGAIVQIVDLRRRLGLAPTEPTRTSRIVIVTGEDGKLAGLLVDAVTDVLSLDDQATRSATQSDSGFVEALCLRGEDFVSLVDLDRVLEFDAEH